MVVHMKNKSSHVHCILHAATSTECEFAIVLVDIIVTNVLIIVCCISDYSDYLSNKITNEFGELLS